MDTERPDGLRTWLAWLRTPDCPCPYEWRSIGILYGVSFGKGWVRIGAARSCPHHADRRRDE
jgi:hypothetical protein